MNAEMENVRPEPRGLGREASRFGGRGFAAAVAVAALLALAGLVLWFVQLNDGLSQTGMRNLDSWGLYITMFMFLVGLSAGGLIISSIPNAFGMEGFGGISKVAVWTSICCTVLAMGFVLVDMGHPERVWELFASANLTSPLMWDVFVLLTYLILSMVYLWAMVRRDAGRFSAVGLRAISVVALVTAVLVHSVTAWIFALQAGREMWHTALLAPWFVSSALVCGTALVMAVVVALRRAGYLSVDQRYIIKLAKMLGAFVCVDIYFFGCDLLTEAYPGGSGVDVAAMLVSGPLAPFFWAEIAASLVCVVICFTPALRRSTLLIIGAVAAIVGIFCKRVQLLVGGFQIANLPQPNPLNDMTITFWENGMENAYAGLVYWPEPIELGIVAGVIGLGALMLLLGLRYLPLRPAKEER